MRPYQAHLWATVVHPRKVGSDRQLVKLNELAGRLTVHWTGRLRGEDLDNCLLQFFPFPIRILELPFETVGESLDPLAFHRMTSTFPLAVKSSLSSSTLTKSTRMCSIVLSISISVIPSAL